VSEDRPATTDRAALFLTREELRELTGYQISRYQIAWLKARRWRFETTAAGVPRVARAYFERKMVGEAKTADPLPSAATEPDWEALRAWRRRK
jgi:hypothetical protein